MISATLLEEFEKLRYNIKRKKRRKG